jgi:urease accessory protein UreE
MLCESIRDFLHDGLPPKPLDFVDVTWHQTLRRTLRQRSRGGREVGILLPIGQRIAHHAILFEDEHVRVAVNVLPTEVFIARPGTIEAMGKLALELGNLHVPVQIAGDALITPADGPAEEVLDRLGISYVQKAERFEPTPVIAAVGFAEGFRIISPTT